MFAGGVATFADLYAIQAVLPALSDTMRISESTASLAISFATAGLAVAVLPWAAVADRIGRVRAMVIATSVAAGCGLLLPASPGIGILLALRAVSGAALAALPALAMAHLVERAAPGRAAAMGGIYIAGTSIGGLTGRIVTGTVAGLIGGENGWRWGLAAVALVVVGLAVVFAVLLPRTGPAPLLRHSRGADADSGSAPELRHPRIRTALASRAVWSLYAQGFLLMGGFVTLYNLLAFRLLAAPYRVPASLVSLMFVIYLVGTASSATVGRLIGRFGRRRVMLAGGCGMAAGTLLTLTRPLPLIVVGLMIATFSFFLAHAIAAAWCGVLVPTARSQATAMYSLTYYLGSSIVGYLGALVFTKAGWTGAALMVVAAAIASVGIARALAPPDRPRPRAAVPNNLI